MGERTAGMKEDFPVRYEQVKAACDQAYIRKMSFKEYKEWKRNFEKYKELFSGEVKFDRNQYHESLNMYLENPRFMMIYDILDPLMLSEIYDDPGFAIEIKHEREHLAKAKQLGFENPSFGIFFFDDEWDNVNVQYFMHPGPIPAGMGDGEFVEALKVITAAPSRLSKGDRFVLGKKEDD